MNKIVYFVIMFSNLNNLTLAKNIEIINLANSDKEHILGIDFNLAKSNLVSFINCQRFADREKLQEQELTRCMSQFMHPNVTSFRILQYTHFLKLKHVISKPYACPKLLLNDLTNLNIEFDLALCFDSIRKPETKQAIALFRKDKASLPKLIMLKF